MAFIDYFFRYRLPINQVRTMTDSKNDFDANVCQGNRHSNLVLRLLKIPSFELGERFESGL